MRCDPMFKYTFATGIITLLSTGSIYKELCLLKGSLDATAVVVHVDFSENYSNKQANAFL